MTTVILFDTETTGLVDNHTIKIGRQPHIIEFYSCEADLVTGEVVREIDHLILPPIEVTEEITKITGITSSMLIGKTDFLGASDEIVQFLSSRDTVIAHNLSFDMEMIDIECERIGAKMKWPRRRICTVEQTIHLNGYRLNLSGLHELLFGEDFSGAHRAKVDVQALLRCCVELHKRGII